MQEATQCLGITMIATTCGAQSLAGLSLTARMIGPHETLRLLGALAVLRQWGHATRDGCSASAIQHPTTSPAPRHHGAGSHSCANARAAKCLSLARLLLTSDVFHYMVCCLHLCTGCRQCFSIIVTLTRQALQPRAG